MTERAWPELKSALHPPDDATGGQIVSSLLDECAILEFLDALTVFAGKPCQLRSIHRRSPKRMIGYVAVWISKVNTIGIKRRAYRTSCIAWGRRDEYALEARLREETCVCHAIQGHAAAQAQIRQAGFPMELSGDVHQNVLQDPLHAGGAIGEALSFRSLQIDRLIRITRRTKQFDETR